ncbi:hypothetical protein PCL_09652 [Purpureocillium lilacinum]|uniref:Uncharacterized protein n=1 Tax=Purpureocillium lilacinum TaxID=33203 RepID=A0A2U3EDP4_PURLI|nr:hypothetical protein PCL_09652 [Purpureocillium lilacinum]
MSHGAAVGVLEPYPYLGQGQGWTGPLAFAADAASQSQLACHCQWSVYVGPHRPPTPRDVEDRAPEGPFAFVCLSPIVWLPAHTHDDVAKERKRKAGNEGWLGAMPCHVTSCHHRIASQQQLDLRGGGKDVVVVERRLRLGGRRLCRDARASREHEGRAKCKCNCKAGQGRAGQCKAKARHPEGRRASELTLRRAVPCRLLFGASTCRPLRMAPDRRTRTSQDQLDSPPSHPSIHPSIPSRATGARKHGYFCAQRQNGPETLCPCHHDLGGGGCLTGSSPFSKRGPLILQCYHRGAVMVLVLRGADAVFPDDTHPRAPKKEAKMRRRRRRSRPGRSGCNHFRFCRGGPPPKPPLALCSVTQGKPERWGLDVRGRLLCFLLGRERERAKHGERAAGRTGMTVPPSPDATLTCAAAAAAAALGRVTGDTTVTAPHRNRNRNRTGLRRPAIAICFCPSTTARHSPADPERSKPQAR